MTLVIAQIPDDPQELPGWLERQLVGDQLGELVAELRGIRGDDAPADSLEGVIRDQRSDILERGLSVASPQTLRALLTQPKLLLELQELVFVEGGRYWRGVSRPESLAAATVAMRRRIESELRSNTPPVEPARRAAPNGSRAVISLAVAASVLMLLVVGWQLLRPAANPGALARRGWSKGLPSSADAATSKDYLNQLALLSEDYRPDSPTDRQSLIAQLREFRAGCDVLLSAPHSQLSRKQRDELIKRCRKWSGEIESLIAKARSGKEIETVAAETNELISRLTTALSGPVADA